MATGLVALGTAAVGAAGDAASNPGAPAMTAPQNLDQTITFGGAHKGHKRGALEPSNTMILVGGVVVAFTLYAIITRK